MAAATLLLLSLPALAAVVPVEPGTAGAQGLPTVTVMPAQDSGRVIPLTGSFGILLDPAGILTLPDVIAARRDGQFQPLKGSLSLGFTKTVVWLTLRVRSTETPDVPWVLELQPPFVDSVLVYDGVASAPAEEFRVSPFGDQAALSARSIRSANFAMPMPLKAGEVRDLYFRVESTSALVLRGSLSSLAEFSGVEARRQFYNGVMFGTFFFVFLLNVFYFFWVRDTWHMLYALYVGFTGVAFVSLTGFLPLLLGDRVIPLLNSLYAVPTMLSTLFGVLFITVYLRLWEQMRWMFWAMMGLLVVFSGGLVASSVGAYPLVAPVLLPLMSVGVWLAVIGGFVLYLRGFRPAGVFAAGFVALAAGSVFNIARTLGLLESSALTDNASLIGVWIHLVVMMLGLAMRIRDGEAERARIQAELTDVARSSEQRAVRLAEERTRELAMAKEQLEASLQAERQATEDQIRFIDMISHEYRTPVSVLNSSLDGLDLRLGTAVPESRAVLDRMRRSVRRLTEVIEVGLQQQRMDGHVLRLYPVEADFATLVRAVVDGLRVQNPGRRLDLSVQPGLETAVIADEEMVQTILRNLLGNALKYSTDDAPVQVRLTGGNGRIILEIEDRGRGIPEADLGKVFEKYVRGSNAQGVPGTGFGLYLTRKLVSLHGGTLHLSSRLGDGTTVRVTLPAIAGGETRETLSAP